MHTLFIRALGTLALASAAAAQASPAPLTPERAPGTVRNAGIYHVTSGTWTRVGNHVANLGPDTVYSNTAQSGYFSSFGGAGGFAPGSTNVDEGGLPGIANTHRPGNRDEYSINCVEIGYCDLGAPATSGWEISFYSSYAPCTSPAAPDTLLRATGLPAGGCWTMTIDLSGGSEFCLAADAGDGFDDNPARDSFGWGFRYIGTDGTAPAGFLLSGHPKATDPNYVLGNIPTAGTNTYYGPPSLCGPDDATGFLTQDSWWLEDPTGANSACYTSQFYFVGASNPCGTSFHPYASWHMELQANAESCTSCVCFPNGCTSNPTSTGMNATLSITGNSSVAADNVTLTADLGIPNTFGFFITSRDSGFVANPAGSQGNICLGANVGRFQQLAMSSGSTGRITISTLFGQWSVQSIPDAIGSYAAFPGDTTHFQCWFRDLGPSGPTSNFTDGAQITWIP